MDMLNFPQFRLFKFLKNKTPKMAWLQKMKTKRRENDEGGNKQFVPKLFWVVAFEIQYRF